MSAEVPLNYGFHTLISYSPRMSHATRGRVVGEATSGCIASWARAGFNLSQLIGRMVF
jgi:hypothetical protein